MGFILLTCALFLFIKAVYSSITNLISSSTYVKKIGQVVGFSQDKPGLFRVVIRFVGLNGLEYFFVDGLASSAPKFAHGEFIRILISKTDDKVARFDHLEPAKNCLLYFVLSLIFFALVALTYEIKMTHVFIIIAAYLLLSEVAKSFSPLRFFRFDSELPLAKVYNLENTRLISWTDKYEGHFVFKSSFIFILDAILKIERLTYVSLALLALVGSGYSFMVISKQIENTESLQATYDRPVLHQWWGQLKSQVPMVKYYAKNRRVITALDKHNPFYFDLKPGSVVSILVSQSDQENVRIDRGYANYWKSYLLFLFSIFFLKLNQYAKSRNATLNKDEPVIHVRKAG